MATQDKSNSYEEKLQRQQQADKANSGKRFLFLYAAALFAVALILILMSYFISSRNNAALDALNEEHRIFSVGAMRSIESLQEENVALRDENLLLNEQTEAQQTEIETLTRELENKISETDKLTADAEILAKKDEALEVLWQVYKLYAQNKYKDCRIAIAYMRDTGLVDFLPDTCVTSFQKESPKSEFERIAKAVG